MAVKTYRFRLTKPIDDARLAVEVGFALTVTSGNAGGPVIDITTDEAHADDLKEALALRGYSFVEEEPTTTVSNEFSSGTANAFIDQVILTPMVIPANKTLVLDDPELSLTGSIEVPSTGSLVIL